MFRDLSWDSPEIVAFAFLIPIAGWVYVAFALYHIFVDKK